MTIEPYQALVLQLAINAHGRPEKVHGKPFCKAVTAYYGVLMELLASAEEPVTQREL